MSAGARVLIIGAGLAGLSAAVELAARGVKVELIEASMQAGGRCRSYVDPVLGMTIDNGNHLALSGNHATFAYLRRIGTQDRLIGPRTAALDFHDLRDGERWTLRPNDGPLAWWVLSGGRRVPGTRAADYLALAPLMLARRDRRIDAVMACEGALWERLIGPFLLAALNTDPRGASAALAGAVMRETLAKGGAACRPRIAHPSLDAAFIAPALAFLEAKGAVVRLGQRVRKVSFDGDRAAAIVIGEDEERALGGAAVILATPPQIAGALLPDIIVPDAFSAIVNGHFHFAPPKGAAPIVGVIGGLAEWVFAFEDRLSVTVSGADAIVDDDREALARRLWADVAAVHGLTAPLPPWQIVKERRATFAATPEQNALRPGAATRWTNLILAGDWTRTGLPATIEGAVRSGVRAADLAFRAPGAVW